jgi:DNA-binding IclR family transcriptional regulator
MAGNTTDPGRSVVSRVLAILDAFDVEHPRLSLSDIARRAGLSLPTTHRLVGEIAAWRGLERDDDGMYRVGLRLWEVGLLGPLHTRLREVAMPFLQSLYETTRENVHLAVRDGFDALYVEKLSGHRSVPIISRIGGRLPMHATGVGKALLAWSDEDLVDQALRRPLERPTPYTITEPGRLRQELDATRRAGYAVTREEMTLGSCSVAVPIFSEPDLDETGLDETGLDGTGEVEAAVGIVVHTVNVEPVRHVGPLRLAAEGIAARLAATRDDPYPGYEHDIAPTRRGRAQGNGRPT